MTGETLKACWHCGETERLRIVSVGSMTDNMPDRPHQVRCRHLDCEEVSGPVAYGRGAAIEAWNTRSLPAALDTVIEAVERAGDDDEMDFGGFVWSKGFVLRFLRALRAEHSAPQPDQAPSPPRDTGDG